MTQKIYKWKYVEGPFEWQPNGDMLALECIKDGRRVGTTIMLSDEQSHEIRLFLEICKRDLG